MRLWLVFLTKLFKVVFMNYQDKQDSQLSVMEAIETLSEIADMDIEHGVCIAKRQDVKIGEEKLSYRTVYWLNKKDPEKGLGIVRDTFRVILNYLRHYYREEASYVLDEKASEGIKTIMILVGEAAKKLDKYTHLFHQAKSKSVLALKEYKKLQEFYQSKIALKLDEGKLGKWLLALSKIALSRKKEDKLQGKVTQETKHAFVDLDAVKRDSDYELFFLRKEDGTRFFNPKLLRNMMLVSDFGFSPYGYRGEDPLENLPKWLELHYQRASETILKVIGKQRERFFQEAFKYKDNELVKHLGNCMMALAMGSNSHHSMQLDSIKTCSQYFADFQTFLRGALRTREYAKLIAYPPGGANPMGQSLLHLVHSLCKGLYLCGEAYAEIAPEFLSLLEEVKKSQSVDQQCEKALWRRLNNNYQGLNKLLRPHHTAPIVKILDNLQKQSYRSFDPLCQTAGQTRLYYLDTGEQKILNVRMGCPVIQEYINKAVVNEEFKAFLRGLAEPASEIKSLLLINLQDRNSWREHARSVALESLQNHADFSAVLAVATIARDSDFHYQLPPYDQNNKMDNFLDGYKEHLRDEGSGYYFPQPLRKFLTAASVRGLLNATHKIFFNGKNMLLREQRLNFIEIFDLLLILKIIDAARPDSFCLLCKDGVDGGGAMNAFLYSFLKLVNSKEGLSENEWEELNLLLHVPAMVVRERLIQPDRFMRLIAALKVVEGAKEEYGPESFLKLFQSAFSPFYETGILRSRILSVKEP